MVAKFRDLIYFVSAFMAIFGILLISTLYLIKKAVDKNKSSKIETTKYILSKDEDYSKTNKEFYTNKGLCRTEEKPSEIEGQNEIKDNSIDAESKGSAIIEDVNIDLDDDVKFYRLKSLNNDEIEYLKNKDFIIRTRFNPFNRRKEEYIFLKNDNESEQHFLVISFIKNYLKDKVDNLQTYEAVKPDIVFELNRKKIALEIETGKVLNHNKKKLIEKIKSLEENYNDWYFVVTNRNLTSKYRKFGKVMDPRYIKNQIDKLLKNLTPNHALKLDDQIEGD